MKIGIYTVNSQSGRAYLADLTEQGYQVYGYARETASGKEFVDVIREQKGIYLERPANKNKEESRFIHLERDVLGHDMERLVDESDVIIIAHPSHYLTETMELFSEWGIRQKRTPIVLSSSRTFAVPYLWEIVGENHPFVCFSTSPYSCQAPRSGTVYIKRRKRSWLVSLEGEFTKEQIEVVKDLFPQAVFNRVPATTSIGNIGAIFHPGTYLLNYDEIQAAEKAGRTFSFYMEGIASNREAAQHLEAIDQVRLEIAHHIGVEVYGLAGSPNEEKWMGIMKALREKEREVGHRIDELRRLRRDHLQSIGEAVTSVQHWLDYTYGVERIPGESLQDAIARTPTYQQGSVPQQRYVEEDVPTGLVPLLALAERFGIDGTAIRDVLELYYKHFERDKESEWRDLEPFSTEYIRRYLKGEFFEVID